jgi:hypothetical protein
MKMLNKKVNGHFDEMQIQTRNKIGNQSFFILYFVLMIDLLLGDYGVQWAGSPTSIVVIMLASFGYYLARIVWAGAYTSTKTDNRKYVYPRVGLIAVATFIIAIIQKTNFFKESLNIFDAGFLRLVIFFLVFFLMIFVSTSISKRKNNAGDK